MLYSSIKLFKVSKGKLFILVLNQDFTVKCLSMNLPK